MYPQGYIYPRLGTPGLEYALMKDSDESRQRRLVSMRSIPEDQTFLPDVYTSEVGKLFNVK